MKTKNLFDSFHQFTWSLIRQILTPSRISWLLNSILVVRTWTYLNRWINNLSILFRISLSHDNKKSNIISSKNELNKLGLGKWSLAFYYLTGNLESYKVFKGKILKKKLPRKKMKKASLRNTILYLLYTEKFLIVWTN